MKAVSIRAPFGSCRARLWARLWALPLGALFLLLCAPVVAAGEDDDARAYREGYNRILDEDWAGAVGVFDRLAETYPTSDWADDAAFWRCYARGQGNEVAAELFACYERLLSRFPESEWEDDARRAMVRLAKKLDRQGSPEYREKVRDFGRDEDGDRLLAILVALGEIGDGRSVEVILERLDETRDEQMRARIVEVLEDVDSSLAIEKLQDLVRTDPSEMVRLTALETLADHDHFDAAPLLRGLVRDPAHPLRLRLEALDALDDSEASGHLQFLKELALGPGQEIALEAIDEISDVESEEAVAVLAEILEQARDFERRSEALDSLEDLEFAGVVDVLLNVARNDPDPRIRREATESLGDLETSEAREALIQLLQETPD